MATRYWVGGTGNWNDSTHWSATSGGVGGASVPTMNDDVYFDSNSGTGTVTVNTTANMRDCTFAQTQLITLANAAYAFNIYGNWTLCNDTYLNTSFTGTGYVYLKATTSVNINSNGCTRGWNRLYMDGIGCICNHMDNFVSIGTGFIPANGTWNTNNYDITMNSFMVLGISGTRTLNLGSSYLTFGQFFGHSGYTLNAGTSTIKTTSGRGSGSYLSQGNYYNVEGRNISIWGTCTFNNLIYLGGIGILILGEYGTPNITINGDFNISGGNSSTLRGLVISSTTGVPITITCNGTVTASNVDFRDIIGAGTANWDLSNIAGGSGDCGGNSGIIFTPPQTQYFKHTGGGTVLWSDTTKWFSDIVMTIAGRVPLPQDDAKFIAGSFTQSATLSVNVPRIGGLDMENINQLITISRTVAVRVHKNFILHPSILWGADSGYYWSFLTDNNSIIKFENTNYLQQTVFLIGTFNFGSDFKAGTIRNSATIYSNDYNISVGILSSTGLANFYAGSSFIQISNTANESAPPLYINQSFYSGTSTIKVSLIGTQNSNLLLVNTTLNRLWISGTHTGFYIIQPDYNNYINELIIDAGRKLSLKNGRTQTINKLTALGTQSQPITIGSMTPGSKYTLNLTGTEPIETDYINITDCNVTQTNKFYAGVNSINGGNNTNVIFDYAELPLNMNLYTLKMYDKVLTDDEVLQNYNTTKSRYII